MSDFPAASYDRWKLQNPWDDGSYGEECEEEFDEELEEDESER